MRYYTVEGGLNDILYCGGGLSDVLYCGGWFK